MSSAAPPNILFLTWHDAGRWFNCYGVDTVDTPGIDRIAAEGCRFTQAHSACAICSPSRAAMMTGRTCQAAGVMSLTNNVFSNRIHPSIRHLARLLKEDHGYRTALFGVQHEAAHEHIWRVQQFDEAHRTDPWPTADVSCDALIDWLEQRKTDTAPWYAQIGFFEGHLGAFYNAQTNPAYPQEDYTEKGLHLPPYLADDAPGRATVANLQGLLTRAGRAFDRVLDALKANGQESNTLVVVCVDHGVGLARAKTTCYDPGTAVGWLMRLPGRVPTNHTVENLTTHIDVFPTVLELAGHPVPDATQGLSFAPHACGQADHEQNKAIFAHMVETIRSVRTQRWKLIRNFQPSNRGKLFPARAGWLWRSRPDERPPATDPKNAPHLELYDLQKAPDEHQNLASDPQHHATLAELDARLWAFLYDEGDPLIHQPVRTQYDVETRASLEAFCKKTSRVLTQAIGPRAS
ncbi:MAG: sulfatase [Opitutales bacterium]